MVGRTLAKWEVSLWFCSDYGWQNVGKVRSFALILLELWLAERWQSEKFRFDFVRIMVGRTLAKLEISLWFCWDLWLAERWQSEKFRFDFARIMVGRTLAKWKISLWFCWDYGWQNVGKVRSFALILLGLWLAERWQSEKFRFDFARIMVGRTLPKWEVSFWFCSDYGWQNVGKVRSFALILLGLWLAERWQS